MPRLIGLSTNLLFPREAVPADLGARLYAFRRERAMTQECLAAKTGVTRWTIARIEAGRNVPRWYLVHAIERALGLEDRTLVPDWKDRPYYDAPLRSHRARRARIAVGQTLAEVAKISGISVTTISRFERGLSNTQLILGPGSGRDCFSNDRYARAHMFLHANEMEQYSQAADLERWLCILIERREAESKGSP